MRPIHRVARAAKYFCVIQTAVSNRRSLNRLATTANVASTVKTGIALKQIWIVSLVAIFSLGANSAFAQEAVGEKPAQPTEAAPAEETPTPTPKVTEKKPTKGIQEMTDEEKAAAGLDKLSPAELEYLDEWMRNNRRIAEKKAAEKAAEETKTQAIKLGEEKAKHVFQQDAIVSRVDGTMIPLNGYTVIRLEDGTKWKQANYEDRYRPRIIDRPPVAVIHTTFGFKMRIEGMPDFYVNPVRN